MANPKRRTSKSKKKIRRNSLNNIKKINNLFFNKKKNIYHISHNAYIKNNIIYYKKIKIHKK
ncbi:MAG: 50S ribosomal protein L32 [Candidatus Shikimatogenerans sp. Ttur]|uniref:Large ribosomal subunit protein bL32 n=1 Tax=Candidatus Shikimatogenerans sp. Ttur TaxID=3158569 RepID=A0AAU7ZXC6_9FLAO